MKIKFDTSCRIFEDIPCNSIFIWKNNNRVYVKIGNNSAVDLEKQEKVCFVRENEVVPCIISEIILKK